ncbi:MAG: hypothetical protein ACRD5K_13050 [Candidatus Acidiferrales bacterium]
MKRKAALLGLAFVSLAAVATSQSHRPANKSKAEREYAKEEQAYDACVRKALDPHSKTTMDDCKAPNVYVHCMSIYGRQQLCRTISGGTIKIGFSAKEVEMSWGKPDHVNTTCVEGHCDVQWVYESNDVYFTDGVVTGWDSNE